MNLCTKPSCARPGAVVLAYDYAARKAVLEDAPQGQLSPHVYVLCIKCAERLRPPRGWELEDKREEPALFLEKMPRLAGLAAQPVEETPVEEPAGPASRRQLFFGYSA